MKSYCNLKKFAKIALNHKIEEVVEIEVEHKIVEEVLGQFGGFWSTLRRFLQAGSTFCGLLAKSLSVDFCTPFLGSIFAPFFGQFSIADLLVLRDFLAHEGGFWAFFRRVFDRTFEHDFATFHLGRVVVRY
jgi:hypothetical protein